MTVVVNINDWNHSVVRWPFDFNTFLCCFRWSLVGTAGKKSTGEGDSGPLGEVRLALISSHECRCSLFNSRLCRNFVNHPHVDNP